MDQNRPRPRHPGPPVARILVVVSALVALLVGPAAGTAAAVSGAGAPGSAAAWPAPAAGSYTPPVDLPVRDRFRPPPGPYAAGNRGLEYAAAGGEPVRAVADGLVVFAGAVARRLVVTVRHPDGRRSSLSGLSLVLVQAGDAVRRGSLLGLAAPGLHLGVREGDRYIDPAALFTDRPHHAWLVPLRERLLFPGREAGGYALRRPDVRAAPRSAGRR